MRGTLEQLLMLARIEGRLPFDEGGAITAAAALARAIQVAGHDADERVVVMGDGGSSLLDLPASLAVVALRNLIGNALRYSPAGSRVDVGIHSSAGAIRFVIADQGKGMGEGDMQSATRRFWRGVASGPGSGLGLTLVDAIASRFGGSMVLAPRHPRGLSVELVLPVQVAGSPGQSAVP
jgi:two-component system sensor histidine kinase QseC